MTTKNLRRQALQRCGALAALATVGTLGALATFNPPLARAATPAAPPKAAELVYVGMQERQIRALAFDAATGTLTSLGTVAEGLRSTWTLAHPTLPVLYAVDDDNTREGSVTAFAVSRETGALTRINEVASGGSGTTYLSMDVPSMTLLVANFGGGSSSSIAVQRDGSLGARVSTIRETGSGPHRRQTSAHAHGIVVDPTGRYALVSDLGADRVFVYSFDRTTREMSRDDAANPAPFVATPGSGPRHIAFGPDGRVAYLLNELTAEIVVLRWDPAHGSLTAVQTQPISSSAFVGVKSGAELTVSRDGRFVYVADRGENTLLVYRIAPGTGTLSLVQRVPSGGERPWYFALHESGKWMLVANQRGGRVNVFAIDPASGRLADTGHAVDIPSPVSLTFVK
ncbi:lactonase family protein [Cupriavidus pauculus]|uniref:lactonase family protein n=1 Tax=Cupriavidus pauculus TaxID=82633 RepID=UPI001EE1F545|nr:lactonase family protein [Cupriavidus pauculus]GJG93082.1 lactonase family protein [Cupriavidus pauculus]